MHVIYVLVDGPAQAAGTINPQSKIVDVVDDLLPKLDSVLIRNGYFHGAARNNNFRNNKIPIWSGLFGDKNNNPTTILFSKRTESPKIQKEPAEVFIQESLGAVGLLKAKDSTLTSVFSGQLDLSAHFVIIADAKQAVSIPGPQTKECSFPSGGGQESAKETTGRCPLASRAMPWHGPRQLPCQSHAQQPHDCSSHRR